MSASKNQSRFEWSCPIKKQYFVIWIDFYARIAKEMTFEFVKSYFWTIKGRLIIIIFLFQTALLVDSSIHSKHFAEPNHGSVFSFEQALGSLIAYTTPAEETSNYYFLNIWFFEFLSEFWKILLGHPVFIVQFDENQAWYCDTWGCNGRCEGSVTSIVDLEGAELMWYRFVPTILCGNIILLLWIWFDIIKGYYIDIWKQQNSDLWDKKFQVFILISWILHSGIIL